MKEIEVGKMWIPDSIVDSVEQHRQNMILYNQDNSDCVRILEMADFSTIFSDYLLKFGYSMIDNFNKYDE